jgi:hypothetical protein
VRDDSSVEIYGWKPERKGHLGDGRAVLKPDFIGEKCGIGLWLKIGTSEGPL